MQIDRQIKRQNGTMAAYFPVFPSYETNNFAKLLLIAEFIYNHAKNVSIS